MSECIRNCQLCNKFVLSQAVTFDGTSLIINLPAGAYGNGCKYCVVIAQPIPVATTITAPVVFTIGTDTTQYPFTNCDCTPVYASQVRTRRLYSVRVNTAVGTGVFKYIGKCKLPCPTATIPTGLPIPADAVAPVTPAVVNEPIQTFSTKISTK